MKITNEVLRTSLSLLVVCFFMLCACLAKSAANSQIPIDGILDHFTHYAEQAMTEWQVPGMAIAIVKDDKIIYAKGFGVRNAQNDPVTPETIFDIASLTKSFTATLIAKQVDEGKYSWNTNVTILYPQFQLYDQNATKEFKARDLIAHNSGLPEDALSALGNFGYSTDHTIYALRFIKPIAPFRKSFAYQSVFLEVAKEIIQMASNESYTTNLRKQLFTPLQMDNSYTRTEKELAVLNNIAQPFLYYKSHNHPYPSDFPYLSQSWALMPGIAGGGIKSSVMDMGKWLIFNMNNGLVKREQIVSYKNMNFIHSPQAVIKANQDGDIEQACGEGWFIDRQAYKSHTVLYHAGGGTGMHALMAYIKEEKIGIVILTNQYTNKVPEALYKRLLDLYFNVPNMKDWSKIYLKERLIAPVKSAKCKMHKNQSLQKYVGTYHNCVYKKLIITRQGECLSLSIGPQNITWKLTPCGHNTFQAYWPNPSTMNIPMLSSDQNLIKFEEKDNVIHKMTIPFLNTDGSGVFVKV